MLDFALVPLQETDPDWLEFWKNMNWFRGMFEPLLWRLGRTGAGLLIGLPFTMALWQQSESITPPAIMLTLFMGLLLAGAPPGATIGGYLLIVVAAALAYRAIAGAR